MMEYEAMTKTLAPSAAVRKIIHIDMDAFYASIEQRDNPEYRGKPLAVGYALERGVVAAASYEARAYGVRSAMPSVTALAKCPQLIFVPARFEVYESVSQAIHEILFEYTDRVEPLSLDEAYLDVTENHKGIPSATCIAQELKKKIKEKTGLTASAGVSVNKFLAKIASDYKKPDGLFVVTPKEAEAFAERLKIEQFWGVGKVTAEKMHLLGIRTGKDLKAFSEEDLIAHFGKTGRMYYLFARGIDNREVTSEQVRKSLGAETTFLSDLDDKAKLRAELREIAEEVWNRLRKENFTGRTVTLKVKYADFEQITRSRTFFRPVRSFEIFWKTALTLLDVVDLYRNKIRLMGLTLSNSEDGKHPQASQLWLDFGDSEVWEDEELL